MAPHGEPSPWYEQRGCSVRPNCADPPAGPAFSTGKNPYPKLNDSEKRIVIAPSLVGHPDGLPLHTYRRFPVFRWVCQIAEVDLGATMRPEFDSGPNQTDADLSS